MLSPPQDVDDLRLTLFAAAGETLEAAITDGFTSMPMTVNSIPILAVPIEAKQFQRATRLAVNGHVSHADFLVGLVADQRRVLDAL